VQLVTEGRLRGMGFEAGCTLVVRVNQSCLSERPVYSQCHVSESPDLPDGYYEVYFADQTAFVHRKDKHWSLGIPWHKPASNPNIAAR
jgi:hypothetical protein